MNLTPETLITELSETHPCPSADTDAYAAAYWHQEMQYLFTEAAAHLTNRHRELLDLIRTENLRSAEYQLETPVIPVRHVDLPRLRQDLPAVFDAIVYLKATDAERLLSRRRLYESAVAAAGIDRVRPLEHVNLGDLAKALPADEFSRFVLVTPKPLPARIVRITEDA